MHGTDASQKDGVTPTAPAVQDSISTSRRRRRQRSQIQRLRKSLSTRLELVLTGLLALVVIGSLLAVGTVHVGVLLFITPIALLGAGIVSLCEDSLADSMPAPAWVLSGLSLYSLLQSVPVPWSWLRRLSPISAQTWAEARQLIGSNVHRAASISVDPGASRVEALKWLSYAAVFVCAATLTKRKGAKRGLSLVVIAAFAGGVLTIIHGLFGIDKWLGLYKPTFSGPPWALSPLLNANNFAGYLNLATFCALGLAMTGRPPMPRWALGLVAAILFALSILTGSRGGVLALLLCTLLVTIALREQATRARRQGAPVLPGWLPISGVAAVGIALFLLGSTNTIWEQLLDETTSKIRIVEWTAPMIMDHRWFGLGRGAYETASSAYRATPGLVIFQHAENFLADWLAEWGIPVAVAGLCALAWHLRPRRLGFLRHPLPTTAFIGILALLLQNLVDLGLEVAAVGIAACTVLGSLWGGAARDRERRRVRAERRATNNEREPSADSASSPNHDRPRDPGIYRAGRLDAGSARNKTNARKAAVRAGGWIASTIGLVSLVGLTSLPDSFDRRRELHDAFAVVKWTDKSEVLRFARQLDGAIERHPADPYFPLLGALMARNTGANALKWVNQALRRDPINARAELLLADVLAQHGHVLQALGALKRCTTHEPELGGVVAERATQFSQSLDDLERAVPDGVKGVALLNAMALNFAKPEQRQLHEALLQRAFQRQPNSISTHAIVVDDLMRDLDDPTSPCAAAAHAGCETRLHAHAAVIEALGPKNLQAVLMHAHLLSHDGKLEQAAEWLSKRCQDFSSDATCATHFVYAASRLNSPALLEEASASYLALACSTAETCANASTWIGDLFMAKGNYEHALARFERAANEAPSAEAWQRVAQAALSCSHVSRAQSALIAARRYGATPDSELEHRVEQARRDQMLHDALSR